MSAGYRQNIKLQIDQLPARYLSPPYLILLLVISIFIAKAVMMHLLPALPPTSLLPDAIINSFMLIVIVTPFLYFLLFHPLVLYITKHKTAEDELIHSQQEYETLLDSIDSVVWEADADTFKFSFTSKAAERLLGFSIDNWMNEPNFWKNHIHADDRDMAVKKCITATREKRDHEIEYRMITKDGRVIWLRDIIKVIIENDRPVKLHGVMVDITENKAKEKEIQHHLEQLDSLHSIDKAIAGSMDIDIILGIVIEQTIHRLKIDAADILLFKPHAGTLEYAAGLGFNTLALQHTRLQLGDSYAGRAALERRIIHIPDIRKEGLGEGFKQSEYMSEEGFVTYYGVPLIAKGVLKGVLEIFNRSHMNDSNEWLSFLKTLASQAAIAIDNNTLFDDLQRSNVELCRAYDRTIEGWSKALDLRDKETEGHSRRVTELTLRVASTMKVSDEMQAHMRRGALLHDIGKMGIPDKILLKPGKLDDDEWVIMRKHPTLAYDLLFPVEHLRPALDIPYCHHEKMDGTGYPRGLKGEQIPLAARIFAVVDIYDAMTSVRPYRNPLPKEEVLKHLSSLAGSHLDSKVVETFIEIV